jgi:sugar O-acyltransferase (sialic acid O-acetyltransferase NeuD family)
VKKVVLIGAGELGKQVAHYISQDPGIEVMGFYDDFKTSGENIGGVKILGEINRIIQDYENKKFDEALITVGYKHFEFRESIFNMYSNKIPFAVFVHPSCVVDKSVSIGKGTVLYPGCLIGQNVIIGSNVVLNLGVSISHDSLVKSHSFIAPNAAIAGFSVVGERCFVGIQATISDNLLIADDVIIGAGSVVLKSISTKGTYAGSPAKKIK